MNALTEIDAMNVLLVDDDSTFRFIAKTVVSKSGLATIIHEAVNGLDALEYLQLSAVAGRELPDSIFLDLNMPVMNGWEFLKELSALRDQFEKDLPVFILTSSINIHDRERSHTYPTVRGMFSKPLTSSNLEEMRALIGAS